MAKVRGEVGAARRVLSCASHDLSGTVQALLTYLHVLERRAPGPELTAALGAARRLRAELLAMREAALDGDGAQLDLWQVVSRPPGVLAERVRATLHGADAVVRGHAAALTRALGALLDGVAAGLPDGAPVDVTLSAGEREVRVLVGHDLGGHDQGGEVEGADFDPLLAHAGERVSLALLLAAITLERHGGRLLRSGAAPSWRYEAVVPRSWP